MDAIVGTAGNDTVNAMITSSSGATLTTLDSIDGGAGTDTLNIVDNTARGTALAQSAITPAGVTIKNIENLTVTTNSDVGTSSTSVDFTAISGLTNVGVTTGGAAYIKVADTATTSVTATGAVNVAGGSTVTVATAAASGAAVAIKGTALTSATVTGGDTATSGTANTVSDQNSSNVSQKTLTTVTLNKVTANGATLTGDALVNVNVNNSTASATVAVTNTTANHTLNLAVNNVGYATAGDATSTAAALTVNDAVAKTIAVTSNGSANNVVLAGTSPVATGVTVAGAGALALDVSGLGSLTSIDGSTATGNIKLAAFGSSSAITTVKTGAGNDSFATTNLSGTAKLSFDTGAGNDTVTIGSTIAAGSTISLGDGNDALVAGSSAVVAASTSTATTVIDGGAGVDTLGLGLVNINNAAEFKNFELLDTNGLANANFDVTLLTGSNTITGLVQSGDSAGYSSSISKITASQGLTVTNEGSLTNGVTLHVDGATATTSTSDSYTITFNGAAGTATTSATATGKVSMDGIETLNVVSGGANYVNNVLNFTDSGSAKTLASVVVTGDHNIDLSGLSLSKAATIDGSALTGKGTYSLASDTGYVLSVKLGAGDDTVKVDVDSTHTTAATAVSTATNLDKVYNFSKATADTLAAGKGYDSLAFNDTNSGLGTALTFDVSTNFTGTSTTAGIKDGVVSFASLTNAPTDFTTALTAAEAALAAADTTATGKSVLFQLGSDSYVVTNVASGVDSVVELVGVTGVSKLVVDTAGYHIV